MNTNLSIVLSGEAGKGIQTVEQLLITALRNCGYYFFSTSEFMSRIRGGNNTTEIRVGVSDAKAYTAQIDLLFVLNEDAIERLAHRLSGETIIIGEDKHIEDAYKKKHKIKNLPINEIAKAAGGAILTNTVIFGIISGILQLDVEDAKGLIRKQFETKGQDVIRKNIDALEKGYENGRELNIKPGLKADDAVKSHAILSGNDAIGIGAIAGGCNFISSYPMSPSTGVLVYLAQQAKDFGIVVEQAEDEISAINMALGSWYAGARGMATTSGGGFALMEEGISLSGATEVPVVLHLAQRPGPATGLPTRTEQGDLNLAVYAGHGDFPRIILAPGTAKDGIELTQKAFNLADKYNVPVIILTDQFYLDSYQNCEKVDFSTFSNQYAFHKTKKDYKTYELAKDGVSKRGIPGYGEGFVCADSDEHDEHGRITESSETRVKMVDKRLQKGKTLENDAIEPEIIGPGNYTKLVVGWGSTYGAIKEALLRLNDDKLAFAYFKQVYPLPPKTKEYLEKAKEIYLVENNATGQFGNLIKMETGIAIDKKILQYNGSPFSAETIMKKIGG